MRKIFLTPAILLAFGVFSGAQAQPQNGGAPMARGAQAPAMGGPDWAKMTPEERRKAIRKIIEDTVRGSMAHLGYADKAMQDAVVTTALSQEDSLVPVREAHRKLTGLLMINPKSEKEITASLADLRDAIKEARTERETLIKELDTQIEFSKKPGLDAFLSIFGITGDESTFMGGITGNFTSAMANLTQQLG